MKVIVKQVEGLAFIGKGESNHWVAIDGPKEFFGFEAGSRPMELLLIALGSCTGSDVAAILKKKRVELNSFQVEVEGDRAEEHPRIYTRIHVKYVFEGRDLDESAIRRAIELSWEKYCPIVAMLRKTVSMSYSYEIKRF